VLGASENMDGWELLRKQDPKSTTKRILKARIDWLSLCPRGKNLMPVLYKEDGTVGVEAQCVLVKSSEESRERGEILAAVYVPEVPDSEGDFASAEIVKDMAYDFAKNGHKLDLRHDETPLTKDQAFVAESFVIQKADPRFAGLTNEDGTKIDATGGWGVVVKLQDPTLKRLYKEGAWKGVSMGGRARREPDSPIKKDEDTMTAEELKKAIEEANKGMALTIAQSVATAVGEAVAKALPKPPEAPKPETGDTPVFKGDPSNPKDVAAHAAKLQKEKLLKEIDWNDAEAVAAHADSLTKERASGQPAGEGSNAPRKGSLQDKLTKGRERGSKLAQIANRARGYKDEPTEE
jgi:hypothetical protein